MAQLDEIITGIYRISSLVDPPGITFNQFVIKDEKNVLVHTGSAALFPATLEKIQQVINLSSLAYVFISHFEVDECGALPDLLKLNKNVIPVGSMATTRLITGLGLHSQPLTVKEGDELNIGSRRLTFIAYPSEVHLQDGLIAYSATDKVLFSSDLFTKRGAGAAASIKGERSLLNEIPAQSILAEERRLKCQEAVGKLDIALIATGHGPTIDLRP